MRTLTPEARQERRWQVIRLRKRDWKPHDIAQQVGLSRQSLRIILCRYEREGAKGLMDRHRGREVGEHWLLWPMQEAEVRRLMCDKTLNQPKMPFALWNRPAVRQLIWERYGVALTPLKGGAYGKPVGRDDR